ncbi:MAG: hypothetical protein ACXQS7_02825 [Candidatus Syntropharchaeia archaeon]
MSLKKLLEREEYMVKLYIIAWIASICATISLFIGAMILIYRALQYLGVV